MSIQDILKMPTSDRLDILEQIWESINLDEIKITHTQQEELDRRIALHESGKAEWLSMEDLKSRLDKIVK